MTEIDAIAKDTGEVVAIGPRGLDLPGRVTVVGLELPEDLTFEQWSSIGVTLRSVEHSIMWWVGDWLRFGERKWGDTYKQAANALGYTVETLRDAKWVAQAYPKVSDRSDTLQWTHHRMAAALPAEPRQELIKEAEANNLSVREVVGREVGLKFYRPSELLNT